MISPTPPTIMRITPTVWMLSPCVETLTAKRRIAPTAMRNRDVPSAIAVHHPRQRPVLQKTARCAERPNVRTARPDPAILELSEEGGARDRHGLEVGSRDGLP